MRKTTKKLALLLALISVFSFCIPVNVLADEPETPAAEGAKQIIAEEVADASWLDGDAQAPVHEMTGGGIPTKTVIL